MANYVQIPHVLETTIPVELENEETKGKVKAKVIVPVVGAPIEVKVREGFGSTTLYGARNGSSTVVTPVSNAKGAYPYWLREGLYTFKFSGGEPAISGIEVDWDASPERQILEAFVPSGVILAYAGSALPEGYLWADGSTKPKATYPTLYAAIGTEYGGDATNFKLPDGRGRAFVGADSFGGTGAANRLNTLNKRGEAGGEDKVKLTTGQLATHTHSVTDPTHTHTVTSSVSDPGHAHGVYDPGHTHGPPTLEGYPSAFLLYSPSKPNIRFQSGGTTNFWTPDPSIRTGPSGTGIGIFGAGTGIGVSSSAAAKATGITNANAGSGEAHQNMPPYQVCSFIVKI